MNVKFVILIVFWTFFENLAAFFAFVKGQTNSRKSLFKGGGLALIFGGCYCQESLSLRKGYKAHVEKQPAVLPAADFDFAVAAFAVSDGHIDDFMVEA